jgi:drug/metabolite transporter (DMT)-like permease
MTYTHLGLMLLLSAIWGASFMLIKIAVGDLGPMTLAGLRVLVGSLMLALIIRLRGQQFPRGWRLWGRFAVMGAAGILVPFAAISWGTQYIASGLSAILNASMPLFTFVIAMGWGNEKATWKRALGVAVGFGGILILTWPSLRGGLQASLLGELAIVFASLSYAVAIVYAKRRLSDQPPMLASLGQVSTGFAMFVPLMLLERPWQRTPSLVAIGAVVALGVFGTAIAYLIYYRLLAAVGATTTSIVTYIVPVFGIFWGWAILGERLSWHAFVALGMILSGLLLINKLPVRQRTAPSTHVAETGS